MSCCVRRRAASTDGVELLPLVADKPELELVLSLDDWNRAARAPPPRREPGRDVSPTPDAST